MLKNKNLLKLLTLSSVLVIGGGLLSGCQSNSANGDNHSSHVDEVAKRKDNNYLKAEKKYHFKANVPYPEKNGNYQSYVNSHSKVNKDNNAFNSDDNNSAFLTVRNTYQSRVSAVLTRSDADAKENQAENHTNSKPMTFMTYAREHGIDTKLPEMMLSYHQLTTPHYWSDFFQNAHPSAHHFYLDAINATNSTAP